MDNFYKVEKKLMGIARDQSVSPSIAWYHLKNILSAEIICSSIAEVKKTFTKMVS
jgi:hypothetical protein